MFGTVVAFFTGPAEQYEEYAEAQRVPKPFKWDAIRWKRDLQRCASKSDMVQMLKFVADHNRSLVVHRRHSPGWDDALMTYSSRDILFKPGSRETFTKSHQLPRITFAKQTTGEAAQMLLQSRKRRVVALNFANGFTVGGGYVHGALAQEEDLCRQCPLLYPSLKNAERQRFYPFGPSAAIDQSTGQIVDRRKYVEVLFTPDVPIHRGSQATGYEMLGGSNFPKVSFVSAAAPNRKLQEPFFADAIKQTLTVAMLFPQQLVEDWSAKRGNWSEPLFDTIILGAWGCGAFHNPPATIASLFADVIEKVGTAYKRVHFAIPEMGDENYAVFLKVLRERFSHLVVVDGYDKVIQ